MNGNGNPLVVVVGLDPELHEIPPVLQHYLTKLQKETQIAFLDEGSLDNPETLTTLKNLLKELKFLPKNKQKIISLK